MTTATTEPSASSDAALAAGTEVGEYRIEAPIGRGGFGMVYRAVHPLIGKQVAIKVLARRFSADDEIVSRFQAEAKAVNQIRHRNIIDIFSFGQLDDGRSYYVMELLDGQPLDRVLERGPLPLAEAVPILLALARALDAAHAKGIAHRDLKPENVFLACDPDGATFPKLLDFGIAKLLAPEVDVQHHTGTGVPMGTPSYMSPEQCRGRDVDHRTDIYSFGILTYRVLTGAFPFIGDFMELMMKQTGEEPAPPSSHVPSLSRDVDEAIAWMMKKDRAERPPTLVDAVAALDPSIVVQRSSRGSLPPPKIASAAAVSDTAFAPTTLPERRSRTSWLLAAALVVAAAAAVVFVLLRPSPTTSLPLPPWQPPVISHSTPAPAPAPAPAPPPATVQTTPEIVTAPPPPPPPKHTTVRRPKPKPAPPAQASTGSNTTDTSGTIIDIPHEQFSNPK